LLALYQKSSPHENGLRSLIASKSTLKSFHSKGDLLPLFDASPKETVVEAFYTRLRPRDKEREIVGPLKLKTHSSLERVYNELQMR